MLANEKFKRADFQDKFCLSILFCFERKVHEIVFMDILAHSLALLFSFKYDIYMLARIGCQNWQVNYTFSNYLA